MATAEARELEVAHEWDKSMWDWPLEAHSGIVKNINDKTCFHVTLDLIGYKPEEVRVMVVGQEVSITCEHETRSDAHGTITRSMSRAYHLPHDVEASTLTSRFHIPGHLALDAWKKGMKPKDAKALCDHLHSLKKTGIASK